MNESIHGTGYMEISLAQNVVAFCLTGIFCIVNSGNHRTGVSNSAVAFEPVPSDSVTIYAIEASVWYYLSWKSYGRPCFIGGAFHGQVKNTQFRDHGIAIAVILVAYIPETGDQRCVKTLGIHKRIFRSKK